jgi:hypothetical protein
MKSEFLKVEDAADRWVPPTSDSLNNKRVLSDAYWILFWTRPWNLNLIRLRDAANGWVPDIRISKHYMCYLNFIFILCECWYSAVIFKPAREIRLYKVWLTDAAYWWVPYIRVSEQYIRHRWRVDPECQTIWKRNVCSVKWIYFVIHDYCILDIFLWTHPWNIVRLMTLLMGGSLISVRIIFSQKKHVSPRPPLRSRLHKVELESA